MVAVLPKARVGSIPVGGNSCSAELLHRSLHALTCFPARLPPQPSPRLRQVAAGPPKRLRHMRALFSGPLVINNAGSPLAGRVQDPDENNIKGVGWGTGESRNASG